MNIGKFVLNVIVAFVAYGVLYGVVGPMIFADGYAAIMSAAKPPEEVFMSEMAYHMVQTIVFVWLFNKAVGSGDLKAGAMFGLMIGLYLMASDSIWFSTLKDYPSGGRMALSILNLVNSAIVGALLAFMQGKGWGSAAEASD